MNWAEGDKGEGGGGEGEAELGGDGTVKNWENWETRRGGGGRGKGRGRLPGRGGKKGLHH